MLSWYKMLIKGQCQLSGRINRKTYWFRLIAIHLLLLFISFTTSYGGLVYSIVSITIILFYAFPFVISTYVRRIHDLGQGGTGVCVAWILGGSFLVIPGVILGIMVGEEKENEYGAKPE
ncbi:MAG: DUF805 domain-containing protein [Aestuariivita sp.]|nr:DUF805 domain-containing protein [Aestuariivita sp.]